MPYCFALRRIRNIIPESVAWSIYYAFIYPHLVFMCSVFGSSCQNALEPLQRLQNKTLKIIRKLPYLTPTIEVYPTGTLRFKEIYFYDILIMFYKITRGELKSSVSLRTGQTVHNHFTRTRHHFRVPRSRTEVSRRSALRMGLHVFNNIPGDLKSIGSLAVYKTRIKSFITSNFGFLENLVRFSVN